MRGAEEKEKVRGSRFRLSLLWEGACIYFLLVYEQLGYGVLLILLTHGYTSDVPGPPTLLPCLTRDSRFFSLPAEGGGDLRHSCTREAERCTQNWCRGPSFSSALSCYLWRNF